MELVGRVHEKFCEDITGNGQSWATVTKVRQH